MPALILRLKVAPEAEAMSLQVGHIHQVTLARAHALLGKGQANALAAVLPVSASAAASRSHRTSKRVRFAAAEELFLIPDRTALFKAAGFTIVQIAPRLPQCELWHPPPGKRPRGDEGEDEVADAVEEQSYQAELPAFAPDDSLTEELHLHMGSTVGPATTADVRQWMDTHMQEWMDGCDAGPQEADASRAVRGKRKRCREPLGALAEHGDLGLSPLNSVCWCDGAAPDRCVVCSRRCSAYCG